MFENNNSTILEGIFAPNGQANLFKEALNGVGLKAHAINLRENRYGYPGSYFDINKNN